MNHTQASCCLPLKSPPPLVRCCPKGDCLLLLELVIRGYLGLNTQNLWSNNLFWHDKFFDKRKARTCILLLEDNQVQMKTIIRSQGKH